ncbi:MAG: DUF4351 domain-containing protein [Planctomycetaceae bacterium]|nr:DUF4351 domain-containing protein [Planctomycetaceae bacterium]
MKESTTYQAILEEGREEGRKDEALRVLLALGTRRFGKPSAAVSRKLRSCDIAALDRLIERILDAGSWNDLVAAQ